MRSVWSRARFAVVVVALVNAGHARIRNSHYIHINCCLSTTHTHTHTHSLSLSRSTKKMPNSGLLRLGAGLFRPDHQQSLLMNVHARNACIKRICAVSSSLRTGSGVNQRRRRQLKG
jgi:hypothetical protein